MSYPFSSLSCGLFCLPCKHTIAHQVNNVKYIFVDFVNFL
nr:MAG TPA: hypothetical protein [Caudoviricetes sp.]